MPTIKSKLSYEDDLQNGQKRLTIHLQPIAYERDGALLWIRNKLEDTGDPAFPIGVDELVEFKVKTRLSGSSSVIHFGHGKSHVRYTPLNTNNVQGIVDGQSITYPEAWPNADLVLIIAGHKMQEDIILRPNHPRSFSFRIDSHAGFNPEALTFGEDFYIRQPSLEHRGTLDLPVPLGWQVSQSGGKYILNVTLPEGDWSGWVLDPTFAVQPDATAGIDTTIGSAVPTYNMGAMNSFNIGEGNADSNVTRGLVKFNLADLPSDAVISSAVLSLYCTANYSSNARNFCVCRQKRAWLEGTRIVVVDSPATGATWLRYDLTNTWASPGGFNAADCEQMSIATRAFTASETLNEFKDFPFKVKTKADLDLGNGWMIKTEGESNDRYDFASSDNTTVANRPKLTIEYGTTHPNNPPWSDDFEDASIAGAWIPITQSCLTSGNIITEASGKLTLYAAPFNNWWDSGLDRAPKVLLMLPTTDFKAVFALASVNNTTYGDWGAILYQDSNNAVMLSCNLKGDQSGMWSLIGGSVVYPSFTSGPLPTTGAHYFEISKVGTTYYFKHSNDNITWVNTYQTNSLGIIPTKIGFYARSWDNAATTANLESVSITTPDLDGAYSPMICVIT